jgi:hypothetical protein
MSAQATLDRADLFPVFEDMDLSCRATRAANGVIRSLDGRGGFDGWFDNIDEETQVEIVEEIAQVIELVYPKPRKLTEDEIQQIVDNAVSAARESFERRLNLPVIDYGKVQGYVSDIRNATRSLHNPQGKRAMSESKKATALETVNALADSLFSQMTREGSIVSLPSNIGDTTLPEGITVESRALHQEHPVNLVAATAEALGRIGIEAFKGDEKLEQLSVEFGYGADSVAGTIQRSKEYPAGGIPKEGEERDPNAVITKYGIVSMKYGVNAHANKGVLKKVRDSINERAKAALAG